MDDHELIQKANKMLENTWEIVLRIVEGEQLKDDITFATRKLLSYNPQAAIGSRLRPQIHSSVSDVCSIIACLVHEISADYSSPEKWKLLFYCYLAMDDIPNAYSAGANLLSLKSNIKDPYFNYALGSVYQRLQYHAEAYATFSKVEKISPSFEQITDLEFRLAIAARTLGKHQQAEILLTQLLEAPPMYMTEDDIKFQLAFTYQIADNGKKNETETIRMYEDLLLDHPDCVEVRQQLVWYYSIKEDVKSLNRAEELIQGHTDPILQFAAARISVKRNEMTEAYQKYQQSTNLWSDCALFWLGLGVLYMKNQQYEDAIVAFQRALYIQNDIEEGWLNFGLIYEIRNETDNARKIYTTGLQSCRDSKLISDRLVLFNNPGRKIMNRSSLLNEINYFDGSKYFIQPAERIGNEFASNIPLFSPNCFVPYQIDLDTLGPQYRSIFLK